MKFYSIFVFNYAMHGSQYHFLTGTNNYPAIKIQTTNHNKWKCIAATKVKCNLYAIKANKGLRCPEKTWVFQSTFVYSSCIV